MSSHRSNPHSKGRRAERTAAGVWRASRARVVLVFGAIGIAIAAWSPPPLSADAGSLAHALEEATDGEVEPANIRWEPSRGALVDSLIGRHALFLSRGKSDGTHDVWRARVRMTPEGRVLRVVDTYNLTATPLGDDHAIVIHEERAAFATVAFGQEQSVALLDLAGEGAQNKAASVSERATNWLTNLQKTGTGEGIGRIDVTFDDPAQAVGLNLSDRALTIEFVRGASRHIALLDEKGELATNATGIRAEGASHLPKRLSHWAVDSVRAISWIGPQPIAWLEEKVFGARDWAKRLAFQVESQANAELAEPAQAAAWLPESEASADSAEWPPANIAPIWKTPEAGEGVWVAPDIPWIRRASNADPSTPSAFFRTFVRPDPDRPYAKVLLVAMDMRQLELDMEAGNEDPEPLTGPHGTGKIPRDSGVYTRVAAAFNGAFKTEHGHYGMMVHGRVLLPPIPNAATVVTLKDGRAALGSWGKDKTVGGIQNVSNTDIASFRQNLEALLDHGDVNPSGRSLWGFALPGKGVQTERSGLCVMPSGHLVYTWGDDISAIALGKAMKMAGCDYGIHLDMNPYHTGFLFTNIEDVRGRKYKSELLTSKMEIPKERYIEWSPKDFFYVMLRNPVPPAIAGVGDWKASPGTQPPPTWMPGIWTASADAGIDLFDLEPGRVSFRMRAGTREADARAPTKAARELDPDDAKRVVMVAGLGTSSEQKAKGLATAGRIVVPPSHHDHQAMLVTSPDGIRIALDREFTAIDEHTDALELPLLVDHGEVLSHAKHEHESLRSRSALGIQASGRVFIARGANVSAQLLAETLVRAGAARAVLLDRGQSANGLIERAGTTPLRARYDESVLYAVSAKLPPRAFRFEPVSPVEKPADKKDKSRPAN